MPLHGHRTVTGVSDDGDMIEQRHPGQRQAGEVLVTIRRASRSGDVTTTELRLEDGQWPFDPIAPATLWTDEDRVVVELHKLVSLDGDTATFETYDLQGAPPEVGGPYRMYSWWNRAEYEAASDPTLWRRATWDKPGDHTHCLLTFEEINDGDEGYVVDPGGAWITTDAYEKYVRDDVLRLRG